MLKTQPICPHETPVTHWRGLSLTTYPALFMYLPGFPESCRNITKVPSTPSMANSPLTPLPHTSAPSSQLKEWPHLRSAIHSSPAVQKLCHYLRVSSLTCPEQGSGATLQQQPQNLGVQNAVTCICGRLQHHCSSGSSSNSSCWSCLLPPISPLLPQLYLLYAAAMQLPPSSHMGAWPHLVSSIQGSTQTQ
jgi:hypothetical protein